MPNPSRAEEVQQERRRRTANGPIGGRKLTVPEEWLDRENFEYRWANDKDNRLSDLTQSDDWDRVTSPDGKVITKNVGTNEGKPLQAYLLKKPKKYYDADKAEQMKPINELENEIRRGGTGHLKGIADVDNTYTPNGVNIIDGR